jgi:antitoxin component of MazEF toxin-antitoxin module
VKKIGGSIAIVIPKSMAREMALTEGMPLDISRGSAGIILRKQRLRPRRSLGSIAARLSPASYRRRNREMSEDRPVGTGIAPANEHIFPTAET